LDVSYVQGFFPAKIILANIIFSSTRDSKLSFFRGYKEIQY